jgi:hypothetical protein
MLDLAATQFMQPQPCRRFGGAASGSSGAAVSRRTSLIGCQVLLMRRYILQLHQTECMRCQCAAQAGRSTQRNQVRRGLEACIARLISPSPIEHASTVRNLKHVGHSSCRWYANLHKPIHRALSTLSWPLPHTSTCSGLISHCEYVVRCSWARSLHMPAKLSP